jgi:hypothetical protein
MTGAEVHGTRLESNQQYGIRIARDAGYAFIGRPAQDCFILCIPWPAGAAFARKGRVMSSIRL